MRRLPKHVPSQLGLLPVELVPDLKDPDGKDCFGYVNFERRTIQVRSNITTAAQWQALYHEMIHVALWDAGVHNALADDLTECICDAVATFFVAARR